MFHSSKHYISLVSNPPDLSRLELEKGFVEIVVTLYGSTCILYFVFDKSFPPANLLFFMDE